MVISRRQNIKRKIKYYIKSKNDKPIAIETIAKIQENKIIYNENNILVTIIKEDKNLNIIRENNEFKQIIKFNVNKKTISEYYIKDMNTSLEFNILTKILKQEDNNIHIEYSIEETNEEFEYDIIL